MSKKSSVADKKKKQSVVLKSNLLHPYLLAWPHLTKGVTPIILSKLSSLFTPVVTEVPAAEAKLKIPEQSWATLRKKYFGNQLVIGLRQVSKQLHNDQLSVVLICQSVHPAHLTQHLLLLAATNKIRAARIPDLNVTLAPLLKISSATTIGFHKQADQTDIKQFVEYVSEHLEPLSLPWIPKCSNSAVTGSDTCNLKRKIDTTHLQLLAPTKICINQASVKKKKTEK